jgi:hypothetical protein
MHVYYVSDTVRRKYFPTLVDAHKAAKEPINLSEESGFRRDWVRIELVSVETSKDAVLAMLNGEQFYRYGPNEQARSIETVLRVWELSPRGALVEVTGKAE